MTLLSMHSLLGKLLALTLFVTAVSCQPTHTVKPGSSKKNKALLFASVPPQAFLLKTIAGSDYDVLTLIKHGQDPHHWLPSPKQTLALNKSTAWFPSNLPFEENLLPKLHAQQSSLKIFPPLGAHSVHDKQHLHQRDPHTWLAPPLLIEQSTFIADSLGQLNPEKAALFKDRAETLKTKLNALHKEITKQLAPYKGRSFLIFHNSLSHFALSYGLSQHVIQSGDASPDPKRLRDIIKQAKEDKITSVFIQPQFDDQSARMVADAIGGQVVIIDPLAEDVLANLKHIADTLTDSFSQTDL
ncbi:MAG: zinc ABC transporter solute-binding protein [Verrucomicrobia bacterium]|nr:zinc ABC transporter solute-binding protein [Verrucomicrobiota bacterium]